MATIEDYREKERYIRKANQVEEQYGIPNNLLVGLLKTESNFNHKAVSSAGARGIAQFMPNTAKEYGINPLNPSQSIEAAGKYLANSYKKLGNWEDSLRSYNMGLQGVLDWKSGKRKLPKETAEYTDKVYKNAKVGQPIKYATPIADAAIQEANDYFKYQPTTDVKDLYISENSDNLAENTEETPAEKDKDIEEVQQQTKEYNFLQDYQNLLAQQEQQAQQEIVQEEQVQQQIPQQNLEDIYNQVSQFVDTPLAQQGGSYYDLPMNSAKVLTPKQFTLDYINSPKYKERLQKSGYTNINNEVKRRLSTSNPEVSTYKPPTEQSWLNSILGEEDVQVERGSHYNNISELLYLDTPYDIETHRSVYPKATIPTAEEIETHERSHASISGFPKSMLNITDIRKLNNYHKRDESIQQHDLIPEESKADLDALRYLLKKEGIYDAGKQDFTPEMFKKVPKSATKDRLQSVYSDKDIIYLMNNVAQNEGNNSNYYGQQGAAVKDNNGYWNPNNWGKVVEIGSPQITMQGVSQPLVGISNQTGEKKLMMPNNDYNFVDTKQVTEYPLTDNEQKFLKYIAKIR